MSKYHVILLLAVMSTLMLVIPSARTLALIISIASWVVLLLMYVGKI